MPLSDQETTVIDIIAQYTFLTECQEKGYITKEKYDEIIFRFGPKNLEMINYYNERLNEHFKDTARYFDSLKPTKLPERYQMDAILKGEDTYQVESELCIGCGICTGGDC